MKSKILERGFRSKMEELLDGQTVHVKVRSLKAGSVVDEHALCELKSLI